MRTKRKAFTLLEVLAAVLILGTAIVAVLDMQATAIRNTTKITRLCRAEAAAEAALDQFLAQPEFPVGVDGIIDSRSTVQIEGYNPDEFTITRILVERVPLDRQETVQLYHDQWLETKQEAAAAEQSSDSSSAASATGGFGSRGASTDEAATASGEIEEWDPGTFVAVRVEVADPNKPDTPLVVMETWLPKPETEETQ